MPPFSKSLSPNKYANCGVSLGRSGICLTTDNVCAVVRWVLIFERSVSERFLEIVDVVAGSVPTGQDAIFLHRGHFESEWFIGWAKQHVWNS